jgi:hypothetical protein
MGYGRPQGFVGSLILGLDCGAALGAVFKFAFGPCGPWLAPAPTGDLLGTDFAGAGPAAAAGDVDFVGADVPGGVVGAPAGVLVPGGVGTG